MAIVKTQVPLVVLALLILCAPAQAAYTGKVIVWEKGEKAITCEVLFTDKELARAYIMDLDPEATEAQALAIATTRLNDQLAEEAKTVVAPVDWKAVTLAIVAEVEAKDKSVKIDVAAAVLGKPAVTVTAVAVPIEEEPVGEVVPK